MNRRPAEAELISNLARQFFIFFVGAASKRRRRRRPPSQPLWRSLFIILPACTHLPSPPPPPPPLPPPLQAEK